MALYERNISSHVGVSILEVLAHYATGSGNAMPVSAVTAKHYVSDCLTMLLANARIKFHIKSIASNYAARNAETCQVNVQLIKYMG